MSNYIFKSFQEYYFFIKYLSNNQKKKLFNSLSKSEQIRLIKLWNTGGWEDLFLRNEINDILDSLKKEFKIDLLRIRIKVISGFPQKIRKQDWMYVKKIFQPYDARHTDYIFSGIKDIPCNKDYIILVPSNWRKNDKENF